MRSCGSCKKFCCEIRREGMWFEDWAESAGRGQPIRVAETGRAAVTATCIGT